MPELAFQETRTAGIVAAELARLGIAHRTGIGRTGVIGVIEGGRPDPRWRSAPTWTRCRSMRKQGLDFASTIDGQMHACGHDIHTATLLGVAEVLLKMAPQMAGTVRWCSSRPRKCWKGRPR
jgi:metal-dependent amidase/aminoacylase/carboxypeptidase family protein